MLNRENFSASEKKSGSSILKTYAACESPASEEVKNSRARCAKRSYNVGLIFFEPSARTRTESKIPSGMRCKLSAFFKDKKYNSEVLLTNFSASHVLRSSGRKPEVVVLFKMR